MSGSGKSSLVFDTIAAESHHLINETYSAFVQGLLARLQSLEADVFEGLTATIVVDQRRMGADLRSTVGTVEHDPQTISVADHVIDLGPGAGFAGGRVCFASTIAQLKESDTLTRPPLDKRCDVKPVVRTPSGGPGGPQRRDPESEGP